MGASSFTNRAQPGMYSSCPIRNCARELENVQNESRSCSAVRPQPDKIKPTCHDHRNTDDQLQIGNDRLISVYEKAAQKLASVLEEKGKPEWCVAPQGGRRGLLRTAIRHGFSRWPKERDILVPTQNVRLVVDPKSALFVSGSVLDYSDDLQKGVQSHQSHAVAHCSCGESFAV